MPHLLVEQSLKLEGTAKLFGAKNATLVIIISLLLTKGKSTLFNVPALEDTFSIIQLMNHLGVHTEFDIDQNILEVDTTFVQNAQIPFEIMNKCRASFLVMGALLARFNKAEVGLPGGCVIGERPIDYHIKNFEKMGVVFNEEKDILSGSVKELKHRNLLLEYPSVGATENLVLAAVLTEGTTKIINAALEPEVFDFIQVLKKWVHILLLKLQQLFA
jgi:UDP-N-acetylglucosamine 1-carboxyvinyltransferase